MKDKKNFDWSTALASVAVVIVSLVAAHQFDTHSAGNATSNIAPSPMIAEAAMAFFSIR